MYLFLFMAMHFFIYISMLVTFSITSQLDFRSISTCFAKNSLTDYQGYFWGPLRQLSLMVRSTRLCKKEISALPQASYTTAVHLPSTCTIPPLLYKHLSALQVAVHSLVLASKKLCGGFHTKGAVQIKVAFLLE